MDHQASSPWAELEGRGPGELFDIVVEAAGTSPALSCAVQSPAPNGELTSVSIHLARTTPVPLHQAYYRGLTLRTGRVQARMVMPAVLACLACGELRPQHVTHRVASFAEAADAMDYPGPKLVFVSEGW